MESKTIKIELEGWEINRLLEIINAIKNFNRTTDEKASITYEEIRELDGADYWLANKLGMSQPDCEHGHRNMWADYKYDA